MHPSFLDKFSRLGSPIHRLPAGLKLAAAIITVVFIVAIPQTRYAFFIGVAAMLVIVAAISRIPHGFLLRRLLLLEPVVLGIGLLLIFEPNGPRLLANLLIRSTLCLGTMLLLSNTTPFSQLLRVLRSIRVPALLITTLALMYRYLFVLIDESRRMRNARLSRTFTHRRTGAWKSLASVSARLFIRSSERAERVYAAMIARGWR